MIKVGIGLALACNVGGAKAAPSKSGTMSCVKNLLPVEHPLSRWAKAVPKMGAVMITLAAAGWSEDQVDLILVLSSDNSDSVGSDGYEIQKNGVAEGITDPRTLEMLKTCAPRGVVIAYTEWSDMIGKRPRFRVAVPLTKIFDAASARAFAARVVATKREVSGMTNIGVGLEGAAQVIGQAPFKATRRVIDISGDDEQNTTFQFDGSMAPSVPWALEKARERVLKKGITINGLSIGSKSVTDYYATHVIGGENSFVQSAGTMKDFGRAMTNKIQRELCQLVSEAPKLTPRYASVQSP